MRVTRLNDALAVQIPDAVARSLGLKEGDEVEIVLPSSPQTPDLADIERQKALQFIRSAKWALPADWKFDRDEANER